MTQKTTQFKQTFSGSVGAGIGALFNPTGKRYYLLEHKVSSKYHKAGESQQIIVDQIEIGRDPACQVRFDESFATVSRRHAAIVREGDNWKLVQLSTTNTTFLNGHPVQKEWYLQSGDEIQLSVNGPKFGFIVPQGKQSLVSSIGFTRRLSLFRQQALRPYKRALIAISCVFLVGCGLGGYALLEQGRRLGDYERTVAELKQTISTQDDAIAVLNDRVAQANQKADKAAREAANARKRTQSDSPADMSMCYPHIYLVTATATIEGEVWMQWLGTGFMLGDGKFVTARHVTTPYYSNNYYIEDGKVYCFGDPGSAYKELVLNALFLTGNAEITYKAVSPTDSFTFTHRDVVQDNSLDHIHTLQESFTLGVDTPDGTKTLTVPAGVQICEGMLGTIDAAYCQTDCTTGLKANRSISTNLQQGTQLYILGYPHGWGQGAPILSTAICSQNGINKELGGTIMVSNDNTEGGNSGGPIFIRNGSEWEVVAIVSGGNAAKGRFVPIIVIP